MPRRIYDEQYVIGQEMKKKHTSISISKRLKLIQLVSVKKLSIYKAAKRLKLCQPTAKFIIKSYKKGRIHEYEGELPPFPSETAISSPPPDSTSSEIQNPQVVAHTPSQNHMQNAQNQVPMGSCMAVYWTTIENQVVVMPFYYYQ